MEDNNDTNNNKKWVLAHDMETAIAHIYELSGDADTEAIEDFLFDTECHNQNNLSWGEIIGLDDQRTGKTVWVLNTTEWGDNPYGEPELKTLVFGTDTAAFKAFADLRAEVLVSAQDVIDEDEELTYDDVILNDAPRHFEARDLDNWHFIMRLSEEELQ